MKVMDNALLHEVLSRLERDFGLKQAAGTDWLRKGTCPACHGGKSKEKSLFAHAQSPWVIKCGRGKCGAEYHVKDLFDDLFNDWSTRAPVTNEAPTASADAYLTFARGFDLALLKGCYSQETYYDRELNISSATVRFSMPDGGYWERLIDRPQRFGNKKARFKPGYSYKGRWWVPPSVDLATVSELWIVEGIFDAIALLHHGISAVSMMSSAPYPEQALLSLREQRQGDKLPTLVWALDNEPSARAGIRKYVIKARELGFTCRAAQLPQPGKKRDWNDAHQLWSFEPDAEKLSKRREDDLDEALHQGDLLLANNATDKAVLMYGKEQRTEFHFGHNNRLYWWKLDLDKFNKAKQAIESDETGDVQLLTEKQIRDKAVREAGCVVELANCYPQALYFQRNEITDESWYYFRVDFPHDAPSIKNTFTSSQLGAATEFKKRLMGMAAGAMFTGSSQQLDRIIKDQTFAIKTVDTIDYVGYSREHGCYVYGDVAVKDGNLYQVNEEDFFEFGKLRLKSLQKGVRISLEQRGEHYNEKWLKLLWLCFGAQGVVALTWFFGSLFCEQIRAKHQSYPFLEATGEAGAGKTTLLNLLWKLLGREGYEGFDPMKSTKAGRSRLMSQVAGMPVVYLEADRHSDDKSHAKAFEWDELKDFFGGGTLATKGVKTAGNETYEPPFRGTIAISQNASVIAHEAIMTRICKLHFVRPTVTPESRAAAAELSTLDGDTLSHFLLKATRKEASVLEQYQQNMPEHEARLRRLNSHCIACNAEFKDDKSSCAECGNDLRGLIRVERIVKCHAQLLALLDALGQVVRLSEAQVNATRRQIVRMALERQASISADHPAVAEFWEVFDYLEGLDADGPVVNHSNDEKLIAINLNEFCERAAEHKQKLADVQTLRDLLKESRSRPLVDVNVTVSSAVRRHQAKRNNQTFYKSPSVKCWTFKA